MRIDIGLLVLRILAGGMMLFSHGMGKLLNFSRLSATFPDPLHIGSTLSLTLTVFAEVVCAVLIMIGLATRLAAIPLIITMFVAAAVIHAMDPWAKKEFALLFAIPFITLAITGAGRFSVDQMKQRKQ